MLVKDAELDFAQEMIRHVLLITAAALAGQVSAQPNTTDWQSETADFSIRCSKPPKVVHFAGLSGRFVEQIHLRLRDGRLSRLRYSTSVEAPHRWLKSEEAVEYVDKRSGGKSAIDAQRRYRRLNGASLTNIVVTLDASAAQSDLDLLISDFVTLGKWELHRENLRTTLKESTSILKSGKLEGSSTDYWPECHLMTSDGGEVSL